MIWEIALAANLAIAVAYAAVSHHIGLHLTRTRQWRANVLASTVAIFFASCAVNHLDHSVRLLIEPGFRSLWNWEMAVTDGITALFGVWYFYERFRHPSLSRGAALFEDTAVRRQDAMELHDNVAQNAIVARYALDRGDAATAVEAIQAAIVAARHVTDELYPAGRERGAPA